MTNRKYDTSEDLGVLIRAYVDTFDQNFPAAYFRGNDEAMKEELCKALNSGKPCKVDFEKNADY